MQDTPSSARRWCYACGDENPEGLRMTFRLEGRRATGEFIPREVHQGFPGVVHGGVAAAALDEAMGWAMYATGVWAVTARMEVRFRRPLPLSERVIVSAEVARKRGRWLEVRGEIRTSSGELLTESRAVFLRVSEQRGEELEAFYGLAQRL